MFMSNFLNPTVSTIGRVYQQGMSVCHFREMIVLKRLPPPPMCFRVETVRLKVTALRGNGVRRLGTPESSEPQLYLIIEGMQDFCKERLCRI